MSPAGRQLIDGAAAMRTAVRAWSQPQRKARVILKLEAMWADRGCDPEGAPTERRADRANMTAGRLAEYRLTDRLTLQVKAD